MWEYHNEASKILEIHLRGIEKQEVWQILGKNNDRKAEDLQLKLLKLGQMHWEQHYIILTQHIILASKLTTK